MGPGQLIFFEKMPKSSENSRKNMFFAKLFKSAYTSLWFLINQWGNSFFFLKFALVQDNADFLKNV